MSFWIWIVWKFRLYRMYGLPSGATRNFSKFQEMSFLFTGDQVMSWGLVIRETGSSLGVGRRSFRKLNTGWAFSPLTVTFSIIGKLARKPFPGRTWQRDWTISVPLAFSWCPNWLHGKPRTTSLSANLETSSFIWVKSRVVVPHKEATFSTTVRFVSVINFNFHKFL